MNEVEEFLRRVAQRRQQLAQQAQQAAQQPGTAQQQALAQQQRLRQQLTPPLAGRADASGTPFAARPAMPRVVEAEIIDDDDDEVSSTDVVRHVQSHLDTRQFADRADHLGEATRESELRLERQVERRFQGTVSPTSVRQASDSVSSVAPASESSQKAITVASQLAAMLRNSAQVRNAILLSEILQRPEHRW